MDSASDVCETQSELRRSQLTMCSPRRERILFQVEIRIQGVRLAVGSLRHPKRGMSPFSVPFSVGEVLGFQISTQEPNFEPFSWFGPSILGEKKVKV